MDNAVLITLRGWQMITVGVWRGNNAKGGMRHAFQPYSSDLKGEFAPGKEDQAGLKGSIQFHEPAFTLYRKPKAGPQVGPASAFSG